MFFSLETVKTLWVDYDRMPKWLPLQIFISWQHYIYSFSSKYYIMVAKYFIWDNGVVIFDSFLAFKKGKIEIL